MGQQWRQISPIANSQVLLALACLGKISGVWMYLVTDTGLALELTAYFN